MPKQTVPNSYTLCMEAIALWTNRGHHNPFTPAERQRLDEIAAQSDVLAAQVKDTHIPTRLRPNQQPLPKAS